LRGEKRGNSYFFLFYFQARVKERGKRKVKRFFCAPYAIEEGERGKLHGRFLSLLLPSRRGEGKGGRRLLSPPIAVSEEKGRAISDIFRSPNLTGGGKGERGESEKLPPLIAEPRKKKLPPSITLSLSLEEEKGGRERKGG